MKFKKIKLFLPLLSLFFLFPLKTFASESAQFTSNIKINSNSSLLIKETIRYHTDTSKHGIYRYLPKNSREIPKLISVTDQNNHPYPYTTSNRNGNLVVRIGDPDHTFTGTKIYRLTYTYRYPLKKIKDHYELYWDITGEGWQFPLKNVTATIQSPTKITRSTCYSGKFGKNDKLCQIKKTNDRIITVSYPHNIDWNENLTIALAVDPKGIKGPGLIWTFVHHYLPSLLLILPTLILAFVWSKIGRDDLPNGQGKKGPFQKLPVPTVTAYEPPKDLTPAQAGFLLDNKLDNRDMVAEIIDLARKKYLKIEKITTKKLLGKKTDYRFTKLKKNASSLPPYQEIIFEGIFRDGDQVLLSDLKGSFYKTLNRAKKQLRLSVKPYYHSLPQNRMAALILIFVFITLPQTIISGVLNSAGYHIPPLLPILSLVFNTFFSLHLYSFTAKGMKQHLYLKGFHQNLKRGAWRDKIKEKHLFLEEVIPFAIAFGTVKQLAKAMKDLDLQPPDYLESTMIASSLDSFAKDLDNFAAATASSIAYNPNSNSSFSSSGSGFSGGFSGGGGGGGGGGSW